MVNTPSWLKPLGTVVAVLIVAILLAGAVAVPYRSTRSPEGYEQPRVHFNTKNSTRFNAASPAKTAALVARAVYPATGEATRPDVIVLYDEADWQGGLLATPLLKPLNAVLLPDTVPADTLSQLNPAGSEALDGAQLLLVNGATAPETAELLPRPFPRVLWYGTTAGLIVGAALGLLFGRLLFNGTIVPTDWEGIFSLGPFTFHFFWTMWGVVLGLLVGGVATILALKPEPYEPGES